MLQVVVEGEVEQIVLAFHEKLDHASTKTTTEKVPNSFFFYVS